MLLKKILIGFTIVSSFALSSCGTVEPDDIIKSKPSDTALLSVSSEMPAIINYQDNKLTKDGIQLGRFLFYDKLLSEDNTLSCASCHNQANAFTDNGKKFSEGTRHLLGDRNSPPTFNLMWYDSMFWDSRAARLKQLVLMPISNPIELNTTPEAVIEKLRKTADYKKRFKDAFGSEDITIDKMAFAMEQFLLTIVSDNSKFDKAKRGELKLTSLEQRGFDIASQKGCFNCHNTSLFTDNLSHNTGLELYFKDKGLGGFNKKYSDDGKFKTPTLRNVALTAPFMHDGRFNNLDEVIKFYDEDVAMNLNSRNISLAFMEQALRNHISVDDKKALIAFLNTLTDFDLVTNPKFSDPFK